MTIRITCMLILVTVFANLTAQNLPQLGKAPVKAVIKAMTLEEKAKLVVGMGMKMPGLPPSGGLTPGGPGGQNQLPPAGVPQGTAIGQTQDIVPGAAGTTFAIPRLGISATVVADGPAGLRINPTRPGEKATYYCTAFPVATLLASSWDTELVYKVGQAMGNEVLEYGVDVILGPALNIHRNPLCGRNFEYFSEDPLISGKLAAAMVNGIESQGVGTSVKHFAANNAETNRNALNTIADERTLREIYLKGFEILVKESQPWTVMSSYNLINGTYAPENHDLLTKILRNDWGFKGYVMTDWFGGKDAAAMVKAGNDLLMPGTPAQSKAILEAVKAGKLDEKLLDRNVEKILTIILQTPRFKGYSFSGRPDLKAHAEISRQASTEGMVLLKNNRETLPFPKETKKIAVFGNTSYEIITGGTGSGDVNEAYSVALVEGLQNAGFTVNANLKNMYESYLKASREGKQKGAWFMGETPIKEFSLPEDLISSMVKVTDAAIITIGRNSGEGYDRQAVEGDFLLSATEKEMILMVCKAYQAKGKKAVVILNTGGVLETASWKELPDAILLAWQGGQETGNSIADILCGKVNPSGKLASTFPVNYQDVSSAKNFPGKLIGAQEEPKSNDSNPFAGFMSPKPAEVTYAEGIYTGYRYYSTFKVPVSYPFGYGLSYTTFEYANLKLGATTFSKTLSVSIDIKNSGKVAGKEIVQLYLSAPSGKLDKPEAELKGFAKTRWLQPGESQTLSFVLNASDLASFDATLSAWKADAGKYYVKIGASVSDIRAEGSFTLASDKVVAKVSKALVPVAPLETLKK